MIWIYTHGQDYFKTYNPKKHFSHTQPLSLTISHAISHSHATLSLSHSRQHSLSLSLSDKFLYTINSHTPFTSPINKFLSKNYSNSFCFSVGRSASVDRRCSRGVSVFFSLRHSVEKSHSRQIYRRSILRCVVVALDLILELF